MIITRTPLRISFFGGGTDYPSWYLKNGGAVLSTTINKYSYLTCRYLPPFFEHKYRILYSRNETCRTVDEIAHPAVRAILKHLEVGRGVEIHHDGDLPARSGMGTSSAFTVGLLHALHALEGRLVGKHELAMEGIRVEQEILRENVGSQDQVSAAYGGFNHIRFLRNGEIAVTPLTISRERAGELNSQLMLFYTGLVRTASSVAGTYVNDLQKREKAMVRLGKLVEEGIGVLSGAKDLRPFGEILHEGWEIKRSLSPHVSNDHIEEIYREARESGAVGGKLTGAGGGGFMLLFVPPGWQDAVRNRLNRLLHVPIRFEFSGSQIIFFDPEEDYAAAEAARSRQNLIPFRENPGPARAGEAQPATTVPARRKRRPRKTGR